MQYLTFSPEGVSILFISRYHLTLSIATRSHLPTYVIYLQSQGQECVYERLVLSQGAVVKFTDHIQRAQEAAMVSQMYEETHNAVASKNIRNDVPASWLTMTIMKCNHYLAISHFYLASALLLDKGMCAALLVRSYWIF